MKIKMSDKNKSKRPRGRRRGKCASAGWPVSLTLEDGTVVEAEVIVSSDPWDWIL